MALARQDQLDKLSILEKLKQKGAPSISPYPDPGVEPRQGGDTLQDYADSMDEEVPGQDMLTSRKKKKVRSSKDEGSY